MEQLNNELKRWPYDVAGIDDDLFIRGKVPMTKSEVRAVTINKLALCKGHTFLDIGAGTGSVSIEAGLKGCIVTAIERNKEGIELIEKNKEAFGIQSLKTIKALAPDGLPTDYQWDRVFIGGTGGNVEEIFSYLGRMVKSGGRVVANTITIESTYKIIEAMKAYGFEEIEAVQVNVSRSKTVGTVGTVHMMMAENPITIISCRMIQ